MKHTFSELQKNFELGLDTEMAVNTKQGNSYRRMDGYYMGSSEFSTEAFSFQDKADGEYYTVEFTEIVRIY